MMKPGGNNIQDNSSSLDTYRKPAGIKENKEHLGEVRSAEMSIQYRSEGFVCMLTKAS